MTEPHNAKFEQSQRAPYDTHEVNAHGVGWFIFFFVISVGLILIFVWWFFDSVARYENDHRPQPSPLAVPNALPPEPRLQPSPGHDFVPWQDLVKLHNQEDQILSGYAWVDRADGIARIPIDRALDITVRQHLLAPETTTQPQTQGATP